MMKEQRLAFVKRHAHWTPTQWRKVMFSDESMFRVGSTKVWRPSSANRYDPQYTVPTVKHPQSLMVWVAFSGDKGRAGLYFLPKNVMMNGDLYIKVLSDHMVTMFNFINVHISCMTVPHNAIRQRRSRNGYRPRRSKR